MKNLELVESSKVEGIVCEDVKPEEVEEIKELLVPQMEGILNSVKGYGLAAPQVGIKKNFFIVRDNTNMNEFRLYFNAFYTKDGESRSTNQEGCFSYNLGKDTIDTKRWKRIRLIHQVLNNGKFERKIEHFKGVYAVAMQHEVDHLKGKTIFSRK